METINRIYWQEDKIGLVTNHIDSQSHSHWMLQLFLCVDDMINIQVAGEDIVCKCIIIDKNIPHTFHTNSKTIFSLLIEPTASFVEQITNRMNHSGFLICDNPDIYILQKELSCLITNPTAQYYIPFIEYLVQYLELANVQPTYDRRIIELLKLLDTCNCTSHELSEFANKVSLSPSRLSHLFKEEVGVPLKSFLLLHQIKRAFILLLQGTPITQACISVGFDTPSHFAGTVKRMMGMNTSTSLKDSVFLQVNKY